MTRDFESGLSNWEDSNRDLYGLWNALDPNRENIKPQHDNCLDCQHSNDFNQLKCLKSGCPLVVRLLVPKTAVSAQYGGLPPSSSSSTPDCGFYLRRSCAFHAYLLERLNAVRVVEQNDTKVVTMISVWAGATVRIPVAPLLPPFLKFFRKQAWRSMCAKAVGSLKIACTSCGTGQKKYEDAKNQFEYLSADTKTFAW